MTTTRCIKRLAVTGGAGFIGSALIRKLVTQTDIQVLNIDALTYAGDLSTLEGVIDHPNHTFSKNNICDRAAVSVVLDQFQPDALIHLAAESHVDRSIESADAFIQTNVIGTHNLLAWARGYYEQLPADRKSNFVFHHVSTDEVFGSLALEDKNSKFTETTSYQPNSPYSASKAASDHLVRVWYKTHGLPTVLTNCSNNYGPFHFPEKLIPLMISKCLTGEKLPVYGTGENVRDWLYVDDHVEALLLVLNKGKVGESYNIGGDNELTNLTVVSQICNILDAVEPVKKLKRTDLITFVKDRPGHDERYAMDISKIKSELGWTPKYSFDVGLKQTINWYLEHRDWLKHIAESKNYSGQRLGVK